jgi:hypothetical protein
MSLIAATQNWMIARHTVYQLAHWSNQHGSVSSPPVAADINWDAVETWFESAIAAFELRGRLLTEESDLIRSVAYLFRPVTQLSKAEIGERDGLMKTMPQAASITLAATSIEAGEEGDRRRLGREQLDDLYNMPTRGAGRRRKGDM